MVQAVWSTAHGRPLETTDVTGIQFSRLGAHVDPILAVFTPLAWTPFLPEGLLVAQAEWLPQYVASGAVDAAQAELEAQTANGTRVHRMVGFKGTARQHTKTVEEMAAAKEESRKNAQAADKGKMTTNA